VSLVSAGWTVHAGRATRKIKAGDNASSFIVAVVAVVKGRPSAVFLDGDQVIIRRSSAKAD
jgi:hypothetical protein